MSTKTATGTAVTTAAAVSRVLNRLGFEPRDNGPVGFVAFEDNGVVVVSHRGYDNGYFTNIAAELEEAGYVVDGYERSTGAVNGEKFVVTLIHITGKVA